MLFTVDFQSRTSVSQQIVDKVEEYIRAGILHPEDKLPSIRELTSEIGVNPNTIQKAYTELDSRGIVVSAAGRGYFVSRDVYEVLKKKAEARLPEFEKFVKELCSSGITKQTLKDIIDNNIQ